MTLLYRLHHHQPLPLPILVYVETVTGDASLRRPDQALHAVVREDLGEGLRLETELRRPGVQVPARAGLPAAVFEDDAAAHQKRGSQASASGRDVHHDDARRFRRRDSRASSRRAASTSSSAATAAPHHPGATRLYSAIRQPANY